MRALRIFLDSSVFGGCVDHGFSADSLRVIERVRAGTLRALVSELVLRELAAAPAAVQEIVLSLPAHHVERIPLSLEILALRDRYVAAEIVPARYADDAAHVAAATVARADAIISWNFRHIVRLDRIKLYNQINLLQGYGILTILSPREVGIDDREE